MRRQTVLMPERDEFTFCRNCIHCIQLTIDNEACSPCESGGRLEYVCLERGEGDRDYVQGTIDINIDNSLCRHINTGSCYDYKAKAKDLFDLAPSKR